MQNFRRHHHDGHLYNLNNEVLMAVWGSWDKETVITYKRFSLWCISDCPVASVILNIKIIKYIFRGCIAKPLYQSWWFIRFHKYYVQSNFCNEGTHFPQYLLHYYRGNRSQTWASLQNVLCPILVTLSGIITEDQLVQFKRHFPNTCYTIRNNNRSRTCHRRETLYYQYLLHVGNNNRRIKFEQAMNGSFPILVTLLGNCVNIWFFQQDKILLCLYLWKKYSIII